jgi:hypothetical protein
LNYWTSAVNEEELNICQQGAILGNYALCLNTVPNELKFVTHNLFTPTEDIDLTFWLDPNSASFNTMTVLQATADPANTPIFRVVLRNQNGYKVQYHVKNSLNQWVTSAWYPIADSPNLIRIKWNSTQIQARSTLDFSPTTLWINNIHKETLDTGLNFGQLINKIHFGVIIPPTSGSASNMIYLDEINYNGPGFRRP